MATLAELAASRRRQIRDPNINGETSADLLAAVGNHPAVRYGADDLSNANFYSDLRTRRPYTPGAGNKQSGVAAPSSLATPLATDAGVNAAYDQYMRQLGLGEQQKGILNRQLTDSLAQSQINRTNSLLAANQSAADRGFLNSGNAMTNRADVGQRYDAFDTNLQDQFTSGINDIDYQSGSLMDAYENAQLDASARYTREQAQAAADAMAAQEEAARNEATMQAMLAMLAPPPPPAAQPVYIPKAPATLQPKPSPYTSSVNKPVSGQTGFLKQTRLGGPQ